MTTTTATAASASNSNNGGSAATAASGGSLPTPRLHVHFSSNTQTNTNTRQSKKELEKLKKKKESLYGIEAAEKLRRESIFTDLASRLESLPKQIATIIAERAYAMLDLVTEIQTKSTPLSLFGTTVKKPNGEEVEYAPKCCRNHMKNPVSGSNRIKELDNYKSIVSNFDELIKQFSKDATDLLKECAELEVSERKKLLKAEVLQSVADVCVMLVVAEKHSMPTDPNRLEPSLSIKAIGYKAALEYIGSYFNEARRTRLHFETSDEVKALFAELKEKADVRVGEIANANRNATDNHLNTTAKEKLATLFPLMSFDVWEKLSEDETTRAINQDLLVEYSKKNQGQINEETNEEVTAAVGVDATTLRAFAHEEAVKVFTQLQKKTERAKYSGGPKNQGSPITNAGRNSSNDKGKSNVNARKPGKAQKEKVVKKSQQRKHKQQSNQPKPPPQSQKKKRRGKRARGKDDREDAPSDRSKNKRRRR